MTLLLVAMRLVLPYALLSAANHRLRDAQVVTGHLDDLSLGVLSGKMIFTGVRVNAQDEAGRIENVLEVSELRAKISWIALLHGELAGAITITEPVLRLRPGPAAPADAAVPTWNDDTWRAAVARLVHMRVTAITVVNGTIIYSDRPRAIEARLSAIAGKIDDLGLPATDGRPATFTFSAKTPGSGDLAVSGSFLASPDRPHAEVSAQLEHVDLPKLNPLIAAYESLGFASGTFSGYLQARVDGQDLVGEVKPIFRHLKVTAFRTSDGAAATSLFWRIVVPVAAWVLKNPDTDQQAARVPIVGRIQDPKTDIWTVLTSALGNAFITALVPGFDGLGPTWIAPVHQP
ncbi:MAG: DUF748 domain-containing protein [Planctomycetes bacterium]|nr:DUF748 domain-containing protein [Planctomycetota bacterium]